MATIVNDKQILLKESNIEFYSEDKCIGSGDLEITSKNIIWTNNNNNNNDNGTEAYETNIYLRTSDIISSTIFTILVVFLS